MLNLTVAERGGADDERAVGDSFMMAAAPTAERASRKASS